MSSCTSPEVPRALGEGTGGGAWSPVPSGASFDLHSGRHGRGQEPCDPVGDAQAGKSWGAFFFFFFGGGVEWMGEAKLKGGWFHDC